MVRTKKTPSQSQQAAPTLTPKDHHGPQNLSSPEDKRETPSPCEKRLDGQLKFPASFQCSQMHGLRHSALHFCCFSALGLLCSSRAFYPYSYERHCHSMLQTSSGSNRNSFSHTSGGCKYGDEVLAESPPCEVSVPGLQVAFSMSSHDLP